MALSHPRCSSVMILLANFFCSFSYNSFSSISVKHFPTAQMPLTPDSGQSAYTFPFLPTAISKPPSSFNPNSSRVITPSLQFIYVLCLDCQECTDSLIDIPGMVGALPGGSNQGDLVFIGLIEVQAAGSALRGKPVKVTFDRNRAAKTRRR
jgi:hypothetical protein